MGIPTFSKLKLDLIILIFLVIVSSVFSGKHRQTATSSSERESSVNTGHHDPEHEGISTPLGVAAEDLQNSASKYSAKYSAANMPYVSVSDSGDYYAYHNPPVTYAKSYGSPSTSSNIGAPGSTYYSYNPLVDSSYPGYFHDRSPREFSTRQSAPGPIYAHPAPPEFPPLTTGAFSPAPSSNNYNFVDAGPEYAEFALASGGHGHGNGWGWRKGKSQGHGWVNHYVSKVNTDAIGLLGLLGLLSLLSNVLLLFTTTTTTTTAAAGRRKRNAEVEDSPNPFETVNRVSASVLPSLTLLAHARSGRIPLNCTHLEVCKTNRILVREFGFLGRPIGSRISVAISKLLHEVDPTGDIKDHVHKAGIAGRNVENCEKIYPICDALSQVGRPALPVLIRPEDLPAIIQGKYPSYINPSYIPKHL